MSTLLSHVILLQTNRPLEVLSIERKTLFSVKFRKKNQGTIEADKNQEKSNGNEPFDKIYSNDKSARKFSFLSRRCELKKAVSISIGWDPKFMYIALSSYFMANAI